MLWESTLPCSGHSGLRQLSFFTSRGPCRRKNCGARNRPQTLARRRVRAGPPTVHRGSTGLPAGVVGVEEVPYRRSIEDRRPARAGLTWGPGRDSRSGEGWSPGPQGRGGVREMSHNTSWEGGAVGSITATRRGTSRRLLAPVWRSYRAFDENDRGYPRLRAVCARAWPARHTTTRHGLRDLSKHRSSGQSAGWQTLAVKSLRGGSRSIGRDFRSFARFIPGAARAPWGLACGGPAVGRLSAILMRESSVGRSEPSLFTALEVWT